MLALLNLDIFAHFLAAWHANIEPTSCQWVFIQKFHVSHGGWHREWQSKYWTHMRNVKTSICYKVPIQVPSWVPGWFVSGGSANLPRCWNNFSPTRSKGCPFRFQVGFQVGLFGRLCKLTTLLKLIFTYQVQGVPIQVPSWVQVGLFRAALQTYHTVEIDFHLPGPRGAHSGSKLGSRLVCFGRLCKHTTLLK